MISIIIPAYNAEKTIGKCLSSLLTQNYPRNKYEIIVVDDGSTDKTKQIVKKFKKVKLIRQKHKGPAAARNLGVKHAKGTIILFTDSDCIPDKNWIKYMTVLFKDKNVAGVSGTYRTMNKDKLIARFTGYEIEERHKKLEKEREIDFIGTFSAGFRKNVFLRAGGFDEEFLRASAEDTELSFKIDKIGFKMVFQPKAFVHTYHPETLRVFLTKKFWMGYWRVFLYKKHKEKIFRHSYTPKLLFVETALAGITSFLFFLSIIRLIPPFIPIISLSILFLFTLQLTLKILRKDIILGILSPFIMILRDFITGLGIVYGLLFLLKKK